MKKLKLKIEGMHCGSCAMNIDGELEDIEGIKSSSTNYAKQLTEVEFDPKKISESVIIGKIEDVGYKAVLM